MLTEEIDLYTALLGGEKVIETLNGKVKVTIPPETQNGTKVRLKGKGFPVYKQDGLVRRFIYSVANKTTDEPNRRAKRIIPNISHPPACLTLCNLT